ncbi:Tn3 family transposase [Streptomyces sp. NRRL S-920]|uniref:Tn3 family transposase n=1 Tax=Streptomyces sp. NRRL S-920 TaxID=1463921 RepID=UPI000D116EE3|nr:Tn3 family transposase [Streptomyces sp. NRRL S-920]
MLNFLLLPRLKSIGRIRMSRPDHTPPGWPALGASLTRPIRWELIEQQPLHRRYATMHGPATGPMLTGRFSECSRPEKAIVTEVGVHAPVARLS